MFVSLNPLLEGFPSKSCVRKLTLEGSIARVELETGGICFLEDQNSILTSVNFEMGGTEVVFDESLLSFHVFVELILTIM